MQNQTKKILASALFAVLGLGMLWAVGQSQATPSSTTNNITIKGIERNQSSKLKTLFLAEEKAGQTNTNPSSIEKVRLVIDEQGSLNTYATSRLLDDSQERQSSNIKSPGSVVGGI